MQGTFSYVVLFLGVCILPMVSYAQENNDILEQESAAVFLEEYTDQFQELFFEGVKQKGIQNYDKAINAFLSCLELAPNRHVINYMLANSYVLDKQYTIAEQYAIEALNEKPDNYWYADMLVRILQAQKKPIAMVKEDVPWESTVLKSNLAEAYYKHDNFVEAKNVLKEVKRNQLLAPLESKINDAIAKEDKKKGAASSTGDQDNSENKDLENYMTVIENLLTTENTVKLLEISQEALDTFPSQPYFYYTYGIALKRSKKWNDAIESLETGLDYLLNNAALENKIYRELASIYSQLNNTEKANRYLSKIKPGF